MGECDALFLNPRPARSELSVISPSAYPAYKYTENKFELSDAVSRKIERRQVLDGAVRFPRTAPCMIDIGSGDGFHLGILREFGDPTWRLEAVEPDPRSAAALSRRGLTVHTGFLEELDLDPAQYDFTMMIMVIEHVDDPVGVLPRGSQVATPGWCRWNSHRQYQGSQQGIRKSPPLGWVSLSQALQSL